MSLVDVLGPTRPPIRKEKSSQILNALLIVRYLTIREM